MNSFFSAPKARLSSLLLRLSPITNSQALRPIFRQFSFREVSTIAYDSGPAGVSQFTDRVADTSNSVIVHAPGWRGPLRSDPHVGPISDQGTREPGCQGTKEPGDRQ